MELKTVSTLRELDAEMAKLSASLHRKEKEFVNEVSEYAFIALKNNIPKKSGRTAARIKLEPIVNSPAGLERMVHIPPNGKEDSRIPSWLHLGTGVWGPIGRPYHNVLAPEMVFMSGKRLVRTQTVRGQRQNPYWRDTVRTTEAFATIRAYTLFNDLL